jgi:hypothetical protein
MKNPIRPTLKPALLLPLMLSGLIAFEAQSATATISTKITRVAITEGKFGNCMAKLNVTPQSQLPSCGNNWVSFSCDGTYTSKDVAYRMFEMSQMSAVLNKKATVYIDDSRKHNGLCLVTRIDFLP